METDAQPTKSESKRHLPCPPYLLVVLAGIPIFYFINKLFLAIYFGHASQSYADFEPQINAELILIEIALLVFILWQSKRRWYQYSLRTLLIIVTLFAVACSWFTVKMRQAKRQREAVEAFSKLGGTIAYDYQLDAFGHFMQGTKPPGPTWLRKFLGDDFFCTVVDAVPKNDTSILILKDFSRIQYLYLFNSQVTDAGLENLKGLTQLKELYVNSTEVTDAGLEHIKGLTQLQRLHLLDTKVTDVGLERFKELTQLKELDLSGTKVTDTGMEYLKGLSQLRVLLIQNTKVTDEGVKKLQQALPNCKIWR